MKKSIIITLLVALATTFSMQAQKAMDSFEVQVDGLGCPFCAYGLEKKFKEFKGIKKVKIEIETGDFSFQYPSEKALSLDAVLKQVEKAGYSPMIAKIVRADGSIETSGEMESVASDAVMNETSMFVAGNCGMCEARIEKAAKSTKGIVDASWDKDTKMLTVNYANGIADLEKLEKNIVEVGHDTKRFGAKNKTYKSLPACCHYERVEQ